MNKFTSITSAVLIAAGTGWITFGQPTYLHAEETKVEAKVEQIPASQVPRTNQPMQQNPEKEHTEIKSVDNANNIDMAQPKATNNTNMASGSSSSSMMLSNSPQGSRLLAKATQAVLGGNAIADLSQCFVSADAQRIQSGNADTAQLDQTVSQLKNDWKQKYGSELSTGDLTAALVPAGSMQASDMQSSGTGSEQATGELRINTGADESSAQASAAATGGNANVPKNHTTTVMPMNPEGRGAGAPRVEATPPSGDAAGSIALNPAPSADPNASGTPAMAPAGDGVQKTTDSPRLDDLATGANGAGASAQTASGSMQPSGSASSGAAMGTAGQHTVFTVPGPNGAQPSTLHLMQEQGQYKIDLDDSIDANTLSTNLNRHLQQVSGMKDQWPSQEQDAKRALAQHVAAALASNTNMGNQ